MKIDQFEEIIIQVEHLMHNFNEIVNENGTMLFLHTILSQQMNKEFIQSSLTFLQSINFMDIKTYSDQFSIESELILTYKEANWSIDSSQPTDISELHPTIIQFLEEIKPKCLQGKALQLYRMPLINQPGIYQHLFLWCHRISYQTINCYITNLKFKQPTLSIKTRLFHPVSKKELLNKQLCIKKYSKYQINSAFKFYFNTSYTMYYQQLQLIKTYEYIVLSAYSFKEIAQISGYTSSGTMRRIFHRYNIILKEIPRLIA